MAGAQVAGFGETGFQVAGALAWVHCAQTGRYSLLTIHPKRGRKARAAAGVVPGFTGVVVPDALAPYDTYTSATHALCAVRLLRELVAVTETGSDGGLGSKATATQAIEVLLRLKDLTANAHPAGLASDGEAVAWQRIALRSAAESGRVREQAGGEASRPVHPDRPALRRLPAIHRGSGSALRQQHE